MNLASGNFNQGGVYPATHTYYINETSGLTGIYGDLTANNFICVTNPSGSKTVSIGIFDDSGSSCSATGVVYPPTVSYNSSTGVLSVRQSYMQEQGFGRYDQNHSAYAFETWVLYMSSRPF